MNARAIQALAHRGGRGVHKARVIESRPLSSRTLRPLALATRAAYLAAVRRFFAYLEKQSVILVDPSREIRVPSAQRLPRAVLSESHVSRLVAATASPDRDRAVLELLYGTGLRVGECARLDLGDVDLAAGTLMVRDGKGRKDRLVPLAGRALAAVDQYLREIRPSTVLTGDFPLFLARGGGRLQLQSIEKLVRKHASVAGLRKVTPHMQNTDEVRG